jgi:gamma-glutamyltranspeptidase/glutathione hydrolase
VRRNATIVVVLLLAALAPDVVAARAGAVATEHRLAAEAGAELLRAGGTAVDAAIAAAAAVCVVHPSSCGLGGGGFALVHRAGGGDWALDYRECAPAGATPDRYQKDGKPDESLLRTGGLAVAVPGEAAGITALHRRFGRLPLRRVLDPAIRLARDGFALADSPHLRREIERGAALLRADPGLRATFLGPDGVLPDASFRVQQPDLAHTLEAVASDGDRALSQGPRAAAILDAVRAHGGVLAARDLAGYRPIWRRPLEGRFLGRRVVTFPPPGSGAVLLEMLGLLAHDDLAALEPTSPTALHLLAGVMAQGFADRARWYGDPAFTAVPVDALLAPPRLARLRARLSAVGVVEPAADLRSDAGTANVSVVDAEGNGVAITTTINTGFGAGILVPGTGIVLNNEMDDFAVAPGVPNAFGLVGTQANAVAPGKRPQSSMSPTIVLEGDRPALVIGGSGGPTIISGVFQVVLGRFAYRRDVAAAVAAPRVHDQGSPAGLLVEAAIPAGVRAVLARFGHRVVEFPSIGAVSAVGLDAGAALEAAGDGRKDGGGVVVEEPPVRRAGNGARS